MKVHLKNNGNIEISPRCAESPICDTNQLIVKSGILVWGSQYIDRLCGLVVRVPDYRYRSLGFDSGATIFSEKRWVWNGVHSTIVRIN
jgi:hypothetical protein